MRRLWMRFVLAGVCASTAGACGPPGGETMSDPGRGASDTAVDAAVDVGGDVGDTREAMDGRAPFETGMRVRGSGVSKSETVGQEGGEVSVEAMKLSVPEGALEDATEITATETTELPPEEYRNVSPVYRFEPAGTTFRKPVTVELPYQGTADTVEVYWTKRDGTGYAVLGGEVDASENVVEVQVTHFSSGFVGRQNPCNSDLDCESGNCVNGVCDPPDCNDGIKNADETDVDCGGPTCVRCTAGKSCAGDADCYGTCTSGTCQATCSDGRTNGDETDVDCGGPTCDPCTLGKACSVDSDCNSGLCEVGGQQMVKMCQEQTSCQDGTKNYQETDVDCGGPNCGKCADGKDCAVDLDCQSGNCEGGTCKAGSSASYTSCEEIISCVEMCRQNNNSSACGSYCKMDASSQAASDYDAYANCEQTYNCSDASCFCQNCAQAAVACLSTTCPTADCDDGMKNNQETDVDCGGPNCSSCAAGKNCSADSDCLGTCNGGTCQASCSDGVKNNGETDVDCGGVNCGKCRIRRKCSADSDCKSGRCEVAGQLMIKQCVPPPNCSDQTLNNGETDVDCGGPNCSGCVDGKNCSADSDCQSGHCDGGTCKTPKTLTSCSGYYSCLQSCGNNSNTQQCIDDCDKKVTTQALNWYRQWRTCKSQSGCQNKSCVCQTCGSLTQLCAPNLCAGDGCSDGKRDFAESDVDCGGPVCGGCANGENCAPDSDCASGNCVQGTCRWAKCSRSATEICDGNDNDCDGKIDEGRTCNAATLIGGPGFQIPRDLASDSNGDLYVVGTTTGAMGSGTYKGAFDIFVAKYTTGGTQKWLKMLGTAGNDLARAVAIGPNDEVYVVGESDGGLGGPSAGGKDAFVARYTSTGTQKWLKAFGSTANDSARGVTVDGSGTVYVVGEAGGSIGGVSTAGMADGFVAQFSASGSRNWLSTVGSAADDAALDVKAGSKGVFVAGWAAGKVGTATHSGKKDAMIARFDATGARKWARLLGSPADDTAEAVIADHKNGRIYIGGTTGGALPNNTNAGGTDGFAAHFKAAGNRTWVTSNGSAKDDGFVDGYQDSDGMIRFVGSTQGGWGTSVIDGTENAFHATYGWFGSDMRQMAFGTTGAERLTGLTVVGSATTHYVVGTSDSSIMGLNVGAQNDGFFTTVR